MSSRIKARVLYERRLSRRDRYAKTPAVGELLGVNVTLVHLADKAGGAGPFGVGGFVLLADDVIQGDTMETERGMRMALSLDVSGSSAAIEQAVDWARARAAVLDAMPPIRGANDDPA